MKNVITPASMWISKLQHWIEGKHEYVLVLNVNKFDADVISTLKGYINMHFNTLIYYYDRLR